MKISEILFERASHPNFKNSIKHELLNLKSKIWCKDLGLLEVIELLQSVLKKYLIRLVETYDDKNSEYSTVGLNGGSLTASGWIEIGYTSYIEEFLNGDTREQYEDFVRLLVAVISHELKHREQIHKSLKNFDNVKDPSNDIKKYLSDHRELEAYAVQASIELIGSFSIEEVLSKLKLEKGIEELSLYSEGLKWYYFSFDTGPVFKKFIKKIYEILSEEDN